MNARELNKDVKTLFKRTVFKKLNYRLIETEIRPEYLRLYNLDPEFIYFSRESILMMVVINQTHHFISCEKFGLNINVTKLLKI